MARFFLPLAIIAFHFVCLQTLCEQQELIHLYAPRMVHIVSNVPNPLLKFRCQSKDSDLGLRTLNDGQEFSWKFYPHIFFRTLFFCHFYWETKDKSFVVYNQEIDGSCKNKKSEFNCYFRVSPDGFYFSNDNVNYKKINDWA
ncbi:S-protein homolog 5-like [Rhododendron vialii]|uniref:S-protein homolog 5-like n=1 Tax=Rhododendron vialii TaxID=182163 RepID=UPI00265E9F32|nr:S-protein homolog 5-like [Rhododendron vialii]